MYILLFVFEGPMKGSVQKVIVFPVIWESIVMEPASSCRLMFVTTDTIVFVVPPYLSQIMIQLEVNVLKARTAKPANNQLPVNKVGFLSPKALAGQMTLRRLRTIE